MYRSDAAPAGAEARPVEPPRFEPGRVEPAGTPHRPSPPSFADPSRGWIAGGFYVMVLPLTITAGIMFAPLVWMFGVARRRSG